MLLIKYVSLLYEVFMEEQWNHQFVNVRCPWLRAMSLCATLEDSC